MKSVQRNVLIIDDTPGDRLAFRRFLQRELALQRQALEASNTQLQQALAALSDERLLLKAAPASVGDGLITSNTRGYVTFLFALEGDL